MTASVHATAVADADLASVIAVGATELGLSLQAVQLDLLVGYLRLIDRWNSTYNLTAVRDLKAMATQHVVDSLAAIPTLRSQLRSEKPRILDVGSGAGLPGVVVAIVEPHATVVCVDCVGKKSAFVTHVAASLGLGNLTARHARVEDMRPPPAYDVIVSRAYATLAAIVSSTRHLLGPRGEWLALKGKSPTQEIAEASRLGVAFTVRQVRVPGSSAERCLLTASDLPESERSPPTSSPSAQ